MCNSYNFVVLTFAYIFVFNSQIKMFCAQIIISLNRGLKKIFILIFLNLLIYEFLV